VTLFISQQPSDGTYYWFADSWIDDWKE